MVLACTVAIGADSAIHAEEYMALIYHPLTPGSKWEYDVTENNDQYIQTIEVSKTSDPGIFVLETSSRNRHIKYYVSHDHGRILLHKIVAKVSLVPFSRTKHFEPPLPFLDLSSGFHTEWSWEGKTRGYGPDLASAKYELSAGPNSLYQGMPSEFDVEASMLYKDGSISTFVAHYAAGVGLVSMRSDSYTKILVKHTVPPQNPIRPQD